MNYNENYELTILKEHLKRLGENNPKIQKLNPPNPDFLVNDCTYYEVTFCSYDKKSEEIYHKLNQKLPLRLTSPLNIIENNTQLVNSILERINTKQLKSYTILEQKKFNLLIHVYHGPNLGNDIFKIIKSKIKNTGQYTKIYIQTGYTTEVIPSNVD
jgi:hypothetical protein